MTFFHKFQSSLKNFVGDDSRPIVVFSALWPILRVTGLSGDVICKDLYKVLKNEAMDRTLMMPAFVDGFRNNICNLDEEPSRTGALTEFFRKQPDVRRTLCAFFSFVVSGPQTEDVLALTPKEAWGDGSLYQWMYNQNVHIVTIGLHPTHCSYTHYAEWLARKRISYRYNKIFSGEVIHEGRRFPYEETLFVRSLKVNTINDFTWLFDVYKNAGMNHEVIDGIQLSEIGAQTKVECIRPFLDKDPLALVKKCNNSER